MLKNKKVVVSVVALLAVLLIIFAVTMVKKNIKNKNQEKEIAALNSSISQLEEENSALKETLSNSEDESYMEDIARDNDYVYPEERIYYDSDEQ